MKRWGALCAAAVLLSGHTLVSAAVQAGVAHAVFSLPAGVPLAGYSRRHGHPSTGMHDPVGVRALVLEDEQGSAAALVSCDLLIIDERLFDAVRRRLLNAGWPPQGILLLAATHTHSGPGAYGSRFLEKLSMGHFDPAVFEGLAAQVAQTVLAARAAAAPAELTAASARLPDLVRNRMDPDGLVDDELTVVACRRPGAGRPFTVLVGFAAHPTTLGAWNRELSADYPGALTRALEARLAPATVLFFAGAVGDQAPVKLGARFESTELMGERLAAQAAALAADAAASPAQDLWAAQRELALPPAAVQVGRLRLPRWLGARLVDDDAMLTVVRAGPVVFFGAPCDLSAALGARLKEAARSRGLIPVVIGFASDYIGYCLTARQYAAHAYESQMSFNGPQAGEQVADGLVELLGPAP